MISRCLKNTILCNVRYNIIEKINIKMGNNYNFNCSIIKVIFFTHQEATWKHKKISSSKSQQNIIFYQESFYSCLIPSGRKVGHAENVNIMIKPILKFKNLKMQLYINIGK